MEDHSPAETQVKPTSDPIHGVELTPGLFPDPETVQLDVVFNHQIHVAGAPCVHGHAKVVLDADDRFCIQLIVPTPVNFGWHPNGNNAVAVGHGGAIRSVEEHDSTTIVGRSTTVTALPCETRVVSVGVVNEHRGLGNVINVITRSHTGDEIAVHAIRRGTTSLKGGVKCTGLHGVGHVDVGHLDPS